VPVKPTAADFTSFKYAGCAWVLKMQNTKMIKIDNGKCMQVLFPGKKMKRCLKG